jgi:large subunit ribosomal protein L31
MKEGIHPEYLPATVNCGCGNSFDTFSTRGSFSVDICSACHPFYTGKQKMMDTKGRVDRFRRRQEKAQPVGGAKLSPVSTPPPPRRLKRPPGFDRAGVFLL